MASKLPQLEQSELVQALPVACSDEKAARTLIEQQRWNGTPCCPHCGDVSVYRMTGATAETRGLWRCRGCKKQFTVRVGSIFEDSKFPLTLWCRAFWEAATCKNGISALELSRKLQISYKSALFMLNRIRHAMADGPDLPKFTGVIEADETYVGGAPRHFVPGKKGWNRDNKTPVFCIVERGGDVRASVMPTITAANIKQALLENAETSCTLMTDEHNVYVKVGRPFAKHETTKHRDKQYVRSGNPTIHSNTAEGFFSRLKRKINGTHHAVSPEHLHRYVAEAAFLYNGRTLNDGERIAKLFRATSGKRLMYKETA